MACRSLLYSLVAAAGSPLIADAASALGLVLDTSWPFDLQIAVLSLQGLANRGSPALWLYEPVFWTYNVSTEWFAENYLPSQNITVKTVDSICSVYSSLPAGTVRGVAMFDAEALDATRWLAVTASGLDDLIPLSNATLAALPCLAHLPVVVDYRNPQALGWSTNIGAYEWGMGQLLPRCDPSRVYSAGHSYNDSTGGVWVREVAGWGGLRARAALSSWFLWPPSLSATTYPPCPPPPLTPCSSVGTPPST
jgi:hypothetical protein